MESKKWQWRSVSLHETWEDFTAMLQCLVVHDMFYWQRIKKMRAQKLMPVWRASGHHLLKSRRMTPGSAFFIVLSHYYFSHGAGIVSIPKETLNILLFRKIFYIVLYSVFIWLSCVYKYHFKGEKIKEKKKKSNKLMLLRSQTLPFLLFQTSVSILSMFIKPFAP